MNRCIYPRIDILVEKLKENPALVMLSEGQIPYPTNTYDSYMTSRVDCEEIKDNPIALVSDLYMYTRPLNACMMFPPMCPIVLAMSDYSYMYAAGCSLNDDEEIECAKENEVDPRAKSCLHQLELNKECNRIFQEEGDNPRTARYIGDKWRCYYGENLQDYDPWDSNNYTMEAIYKQDPPKQQYREFDPNCNMETINKYCEVFHPGYPNAKRDVDRPWTIVCYNDDDERSPNPDPFGSLMSAFDIGREEIVEMMRKEE